MRSLFIVYCFALAVLSLAMYYLYANTVSIPLGLERVERSY